MPYDAFISYSHSADAGRAAALQHALQNLARPFYRWKALNVFRDTTSLSANPALWPAIERALGKSRCFVFLASPESVASAWCTREIEWWLTNRGRDTFLIVLTGGLLAFDECGQDFDWTTTTALPRCVAGKFRSEPLYCDLRWAVDPASLALHNPRFRAEVLPLAAALHGKEPAELDSEDLRQFKRGRLFRRAAVAGLIALTITSAVAAWLAVAQRDEAIRQRNVAVARQLAAQATLVLDQQPELLERGSLLAVESMKRFEDLGIRSLEADQNLRRGLAVLPRHVAYIDFVEQVKSASFSPDGQHLVTRDRRGAPKVWDPTNGRVVADMAIDGAMNPTGNPSAQAFSLDGKLLAIGVHDRTPESWEVQIREVTSGREVARITNNLREVWSLAFSPKGDRLAVGDASGGLLVWEVPTRQEVARKKLGGEVWALAFNSDGSLLAAGSREYNVGGRRVSGAVRIWETVHWLKNFEELQDSVVDGVLFSPEGKNLATSSDDTVRVWDVSSGKTIRVVKHGSSISSFSFSPRGRYLATGGWDDVVRVSSTTAQREVHRFTLEGIPRKVAFSPDERFLLTAANNSRIARVWLFETGKEVGRKVHRSDVIAAAFRPDGAVMTADEKSAWVWKIADDDLPRLRYDEEVQGVALSPDLHYLATLSRAVQGPGMGDVVQVADLKTGQVVARLPSKGGKFQVSVHSSRRAAVAFSPDGSTLATTGAWGFDPVVHVWDVPSGRELLKLPHEGGVQAVTFSPEGKLLATGGGDGTVSLWNLRDGARLDWFKQSKRPREGFFSSAVNDLAFSPDGRVLAVAGEDGAAHIWNLGARKEILSVLHPKSINAIVFHRAGTMIATACADARARLWDLNSAHEQAEFPHDGCVTAVAFSPDGRVLATADADGTARLWDVETRLEFARVIHPGYVQAVAFSPDGQLLLTATGFVVRAPGQRAPNTYNSARFWLWRPGDLVTEACGRLTRNLSTNEWRHYVGDDRYQKTCPALPEDMSVTRSR